MKQHKIFWGSSYDRGLDILLFMWSDIKEKYPDAELHICYGWNLFDTANSTNPERMKWKKNVQTMMEQEGIVHHGRVGKDKLQKVRKECGIWAYPTYFTEINCITALECQRDGCVPVTMTLAALDETVQSGVKIGGDIRKMDVQQKYLDSLLDMMGNTKKWEKEREKGRKFAEEYVWENIASEWDTVFHQPTPTPFASVITLSIRTGWWNIMAHNLSKQTYKNFEWIIVDDYKEDRSDIAKKYAKKYDLNIKYIRGDKAKGKYKRRYGLVRANNTAWKNAEGELLIFLQDFILIPKNGVEKLVTIYNHNPDSLIAPTDDYFHCQTPNRDNKEDWFDGELNVVTEHSWRNIRNQYMGLRMTDNAFDFEMNWSAIPKHIIEKLNGWWEFFDEGLGYDNTDIALRAMELGYNVLIDDTNVAICLDLNPHIGGTKENIAERERNFGLPYWLWLRRQIRRDTLPLVRDEKIDESIDLSFETPKDVSDQEATDWISEHAEEIAIKWKDYGGNNT